MKILCINCSPDLSYFTKRGLPFEVEYKTITDKFKAKKISDVIYTPDVNDYLENNYKSFQYSIILVGWNPNDYGSEFNGTGGFTFYQPLSCGTFWATVRVDQNQTAYAVHEIHHALCHIIRVNLKKYDVVDSMDGMFVNGVWQTYYKNNEPDAPDGNHAMTWNSIKKYLKELLAIKYNAPVAVIKPTPITPSTSNTYKYFKDKEVMGLKPELVSLLDKARGIADIPFIITSGYRTPQQNALVGGVQDSAHETGLAVDLLVKDSVSGGKILLALAQVGITRFGFYKDGHIHCDIDLSKPNPCYWIK